jgi:hypothetical protein
VASPSAFLFVGALLAAPAFTATGAVRERHAAVFRSAGVPPTLLTFGSLRRMGGWPTLPRHTDLPISSRAPRLR